MLGAVAFLPFVVRPVDTQASTSASRCSSSPCCRSSCGLRPALDVFEPIVPISLLIGLAFGIRAMYLVYEPTALLTWLVARVVRRLHRPRADDALAAYCALLVGYYVVAIPAVA